MSAAGKELLEHITDVTEQGHRATYEPDDGGPYYLIRRDPRMDWKAWFNGLKWGLRRLDEKLELQTAADFLERAAEAFEQQESIGKLETDLPIAATEHTTYSARARELAENLRTVLAASRTPLDDAKPPQ